MAYLCLALQAAQQLYPLYSLVAPPVAEPHEVWI